MSATVDLTGGLVEDRELFLADRPDDREMRDSASFWVYDDAGFVTLPRLGIEAIASKWDSHQYQVNVAFADGRVFRARGKGERHSPIGSDGRPSVLGAGPLEFRCPEPFRRLTASFEGEAEKTSTIDLFNRSGGGPSIALQFHVEATTVVPPWINGQMSAEAAHVLESSIEGTFIGTARYEQLFRTEGVVRVEGDEYRFTGTGTRVRRQGHREMTGFWGHCQQSAVFPSGRGFGYIAHRPRPNGEGSYNEGYVFTGDGALVPARVIQAPWLTRLQPGNEDVSLVLDSELGRVEIGGETVTSVFNLGDPTSSNALAALVQGGVRYTWDGEETYGAIERSTPPNELVRS
ncbi:hypothetical protein I6A60_25130 [Frankia sp. AgB1.9]|uniref:hypothetical protein n=1 Tax=unclassified Frankia TaxID=2632575 RepID=UPI001932995A|nr:MULTISPECIES: hypothetical protein [unclassified Frankia]MBL7492304.1 hypothetical protein [Frankia sp. AgW1.1]MBL7551123.1 hypothetical protein [Frankia sp. AgB1.9]MBL7621878.1 hypothetical protein [Frankia sp. AgB1.8]